MDEGSINFKALRAKFQEEASLARSKASRPAVAEKPKQLPPSGAHCCSVVSSINGAVEHRTPALPRVVFRDGLQASAGKRPISFPPKVQQTPPSFQCANGDTATRQSLRERHMPLVLPFIPVKEHKSELPATRELKLEEELGKEAVLQSKIKKKGLLLPFKASKAARISGENGEEPPYSDLTVRPSSAPGELPSVEKQPVEDGLSVQRDPSTAEFLVSSPDIPDTPSPADTSVESDNKILSTLEKAKKKLSCRQMLISAKSLCSPDHASKEKAFPSPPQKAEPELPIPSPVCLPNLSCLSARPFFKTNNSAQTVPPSPRQEPEAESTSVVIEAPEFPDFDHSEMEAAEDDAVDIGALDLEAIDFPPSLPPFSLCQPVEPLMSSDMESHLEPPSLPDPMSISEFPEPPVSELWSQSEEVSLEPQSHTDEAERGAADDVTQPAPDSHPSCCEAGDNVYEDVENVKKLIMEQNSRKRKAGLRNPYADSHSTVTGEEEPMYHARVMVASKVRKNDLPVKNGDTVGIIRTTSCPKGKWLARDANNRYGYSSVMNVELNIKEMLELGKKAQAAGRGGTQEGDTISIGSRSSNQPVLTSSSCGHVSTRHTLSDANLEDLHTQSRHEALQKLAIFFQHSKDEFADVPDGEGATPTKYGRLLAVPPPRSSCLFFLY
ncbi:unnamed protein product [Tetraodon nigroviridis]|uniref:(spotted green pufferfish) hypothetical protein n=1 Tax=Tetraodon nigroviridis TaxID=99883 RepID=Q4SP13_TETNG|nr:unnamed protein product [Tetraodon nigroviridis]